MTVLRRAASTALTALVAGTVAAGAASTSSAAPAPPSCGVTSAAGSLDLGSLGAGSPYRCAEAGDLLDVRIGDVHATQSSVGYDEVYYKLGRYTLGKDAIDKRFDDWCEANGQGEAASARPDAVLSDPSSFACTIPLGAETDASVAAMKTVVIGPGGRPYLTDGHHTLTALYEVPDGGPDLHVRLRVVDNIAGLSDADFWATMKRNKWVWDRDVDGDPVAVEALPDGVGLAKFADDPYRSLLYFARDIGFASGTVPFQEFYWGAWLRDASGVDLTGWDRTDAASYLAAIEKVSRAQTTLAGNTVVEAGFTAIDLGVLGEWNDGKAPGKGEFGKLSRPYSDDKPGKIAYALEYLRGR
ncbi:ParB/Srx family N-terminal domain-containing protein [Prescottella subtropica]|uniref:ParB/Srx family N-terminal domain-containing protein n=1 Tax=Prescottella subtropica TaxID=2545757 RepID=UPI0010F79243|nr:ParB/Srx family N-terminal domain-containing protein [Prescottella subtropica]